MRSIRGPGLIAVLAALALPASALAEFPYPAPSGNPGDYTQYKIPSGAGKAANEIAGGLAFKFAATPEPGNEPTNSNPYELNGVRGPSTADQADVDQAWRTTTGRPDVTIATLDSGINWGDRGAMSDLRRKTRINKGEAPAPQTGRATPLESGVDCASFTGSGYDKNNDGVFNVVDYACDPRVERGPEARKAKGQPAGVGPADMLDPQDVLIAFTDGKDDDSNGFKDDMVGWDFLDDDNDPYDDVQYGHGTGEAEDGFGEANNGGAASHCPNCMGIHMRVGDSFIADVNRFAQAVIYAVDNDVLVVQEALGTLNHSKLGLEAVEYAYDHGVTIIASAADEAAQHHNWPSSYPHVVMVNSVTRPNSTTQPLPGPGRSYLQFNGCTNFMANVTLAIPSTSCSSDAVGQSAGMAGLIYSAAINANERASQPLAKHPFCKRVNGDPCVISANEVKQVLSSGTIDGKQQADDVDFLSSPKGGAEPSCNPPAPNCTDPNSPEKIGLIAGHRPLGLFIPPNTRSYTARKGHDQFYGFGRVNTNHAVDALSARLVPPEVEIRKPVYWWDQIDPAQASFPLEAEISARAPTFTCEVFVAPGSYPNNDTGSAGDFKKVSSPVCDGQRQHGVPIDGKVADVDVAQLKALFPANAQGFNAREPGVGTEQTSNGRPNTEPYGFTIKVVARASIAGRTLTGEDRRNEYLHRDQDLLPGFPKKLPTDGAASPLFVDLDGDNRNELVLATSDGDVHAYRPDGSELPGWPAQSDPLPVHSRRNFSARGAILAAPAAADLDRDGAPEVVAADLEGKLYAWDASGRRVFEQESEIKFSGKPLSPFVDVRKGKTNRTQHGFVGSPVLADLDGNDDGRLEIVAAAMDRHVYAWNDDGTSVPGFPVLVVDTSKVGSVDPVTHAVTFDSEKIGDRLNQGAIVNTPAVGDITGDSKPEIVVGTNEEYRPGTGNPPEPPADFQRTSSYTAAAALLKPVNSRLYAIKPSGDPDEPATDTSPFVAGWPTRIAFLLAEILPVVGEGITGSPVIGPVSCSSGGAGPKVGAISAAGPGYVLNPDGSSCYGNEGERKRTLDTEKSASARVTDKPSIPAFGHPAFGDLGDGISFFVPSAGLIRALDAAANEYQQGGQDQLSGWVAQTSSFRPNYPVQMNDLQFLTGPSIADIDGLPGQEVVAGSASLDLQAYNIAGLPVNSKWPKLTSDWIVANPLIGSFGVRETESSSRKRVVSITRSGLLFAYATEAPACSPGSWPRFHHDNANSGDYRRDAVLPGVPEDVKAEDGKLKLKAPGDDLLCGTAKSYEAVHSDSRIDGSNIGRAESLSGAPEPAAAGTSQEMTLPSGVKRYVGIRALDEQGNAGRTVTIDRSRLEAGGSPAAPGRGTEGGFGGRGRAKSCMPARARVTSRRIGPARLGGRMASLTSRYRVVARDGNGAPARPTRPAPRSKQAPSRSAVRRFCVRGGGRFLVVSRRGKIDFVATTAHRHATRQAAPGRKPRGNRIRGASRRARGLLVGRRGSKGRVIYGTRRGRVAYLAVAPRKLARSKAPLLRRLRALGLR